MKPKTICALCFVASTFFSNPSFSAETAFYKGKTLTVLINFAAGGPTDIEGRLVARFIGKHIPGQPQVVVQNMPGAGGVTGTNYLGEVAKPDGLILGYFTSQFFNLLTADPNLRVDLAKFGYIASIEGVAVAYIRKDVAPGIQDAKDIIKAKNFKAGGQPEQREGRALSPAARHPRHTAPVRHRLQLKLGCAPGGGTK